MLGFGGVTAQPATSAAEMMNGRERMANPAELGLLGAVNLGYAGVWAPAKAVPPYNIRLQIPRLRCLRDIGRPGEAFGVAPRDRSSNTEVLHC